MAGLGASVYSPFYSMGGALTSAGLGGLGAGVSNFGLGFSNTLTGSAGLYSGATSTALGSLLGAGALGFGIGSIGDMLFGAETKAGIGGLSGAVIGSIIPGIGTLVGGLVGSLIGGLFGSTKVTGQGIFVNENATSVDDNFQQYTSYKKKSWFSSSSWTNYSDLDAEYLDSIDKMFNTYNYLFDTLDVNRGIVIGYGNYSADSLQKAFAESFLSPLGGSYEAWEEVVGDNDFLTVFSEYVSQVVDTSRSFKALGLDGIEQLQYKVEYLNEDLEALQRGMDAENITLDNFATAYDTAIKSNFNPDTIAQWEALGSALQTVNEANEELRLSLLSQYNSEAEYKEYILQLDSQLASNVTSTFTTLYSGIETLVKNLKNLAYGMGNTIDSLSTAGQDDSYTTAFYIQRFHDLQSEFSSYFQDGNLIDGQYDNMTSTLSYLQNVALQVSKSVSNPQTAQYLNTTLADIMSSNQDLLYANADSIWDEIAQNTEDTASATTETMTVLDELRNSIDTYNDSIAQSLGISDNLSLDSFYTTSSLMSSSDIKAFANMLQPSTQAELDEYISILGNLRWSENPYDLLSNLTDEQRDTTASLYNQMGLAGNNDITKSFLDLGYDEFLGNYLSAYAQDNNINADTVLTKDLANSLRISSGGTTIEDNLSTYLEGLTFSQIGDFLTNFNSTSAIGSFSDLIEKNLNLDLDGNTSRTDGTFIGIDQSFGGWMGSGTSGLNFTDLLNSEIENQLGYIDSYYPLFSLFWDYYRSGGANSNELLNVINAMGIQAFASGGVVTSPTLGLIGEAGYNEAVIPLKNTQIMNNLEGKGIEDVASKLDKLIYLMQQQLSNANTQTRLTKRGQLDDKAYTLSAGSF